MKIINILIAFFCFVNSSFAQSAAKHDSRKTNPALIYWQAAAQIPTMSDTEAKTLSKHLTAKGDFSKDNWGSKLNFDGTIAILLRALESEADCKWGLNWQNPLEMTAPHLAKMRELSAIVHAVLDQPYEKRKQFKTEDLLLLAYQIARDSAADDVLIGQYSQTALERSAIAATTELSISWEATRRQAFLKRLKALPKRVTLHDAFVGETRIHDWLKKQWNESPDWIRKQWNESIGGSDKDKPMPEELITSYKKQITEASSYNDSLEAALKLNGEARSKAITLLEKQFKTNKNNFISFSTSACIKAIKREEKILQMYYNLEKSLN